MTGSGAQRVAWIAYFLALTLWISGLVSAGVAAGFVFGTLPGLDVTLLEYSAFSPDDPEAHGRLAAGIILEKVFTAVDFAQIVLAPIVVIILLFQFTLLRHRMRRLANVVRLICIGAAFALAGYHIFAQAPVMNRHLRAYWEAAKAGEIEIARSHQAEFNMLHPRAELILNTNLFLLLVALGASASSTVPLADELRARGHLETPRLAEDQ